MKNLQQEQFLKSYTIKYSFDYIDHPQKSSFTILRHSKEGDFSVMFADSDINLGDLKETLKTFDIEMGITKNDKIGAAMNDFYNKLNSAIEGTILEASYEFHFMNRVTNALDKFLGEHPELTVREPEENGSVVRWTFVKKINQSVTL